MTRAQPLNVADKLDEARALIEKGWCRGDYRDGDKFCALGAVIKASGREEPLFSGMLNALRDARDGSNLPVWCWNDAPERTQAEVIEAFKKAAELARAEA